MRTNNFPFNWLKSLALLAASFAASTCGSGSGTLNQGVPNGTVVSQGSLVAQACVGNVVPTVAGSVALYSQGGTSYAFNISGYTFSGGGCDALSLYYLGDNGYVDLGSVGTSVQSQNFYFSASSAPSSIALHCNGQAGPAAFDCATANLL